MGLSWPVKRHGDSTSAAGIVLSRAAATNARRSGDVRELVPDWYRRPSGADWRSVAHVYYSRIVPRLNLPLTTATALRSP